MKHVILSICALRESLTLQLRPGMISCLQPWQKNLFKEKGKRTLYFKAMRLAKAASFFAVS